MGENGRTLIPTKPGVSHGNDMAGPTFPIDLHSDGKRFGIERQLEGQGIAP
ncbi:hypothetical protein [Phyllobacterium phragmitis]|uniref:hypothetical protein n=1 Tax=Phyllobacterium phragmitis TaxID=2670329 RepID=UPI001304F1E6|nr:hypothetical protein [Phyllobacterium phragmitis]